MDLNNHIKNHSRRVFLQGLGCFVAIGTLLPRPARSMIHDQSNFHIQGDIPLEQLDYAIFSRLEGDHFTIGLSPEKKIIAQLIEVKNSPSEDGRQERFTLLFEADASHSLEQRMYDFEHPEIGNCSIFIVPVGSNGKTTQYEAVFNRLLA